MATLRKVTYQLIEWNTYLYVNFNDLMNFSSSLFSQKICSITNVWLSSKYSFLEGRLNFQISTSLLRIYQKVISKAYFRKLKFYFNFFPEHRLRTTFLVKQNASAINMNKWVEISGRAYRRPIIGYGKGYIEYVRHFIL